MRRASTDLSSFMFGMPYMSRPPGASLRSYTVTWWPWRLSRKAADRPAGPLPTTATVAPVRTFGGRGMTQPCSQAVSARYSSISRIVTASPFSAQVHEASHGAGQTRPVNSGNGDVASRRRQAWRVKPR